MFLAERGKNMGVKLRKGRAVVAEYRTAYEAAADAETLQRCFSDRAEHVKDILNKNAFALCINGAKIRAGCGFVYECKKE